MTAHSDALREIRIGRLQGAPLQRIAVLMPAEASGFVALNPETGTASQQVTQGETIEEAITNLKEATSVYLEEFPQAAKSHPLVTG